MALDENIKTLVLHVAALLALLIHSSRKTQLRLFLSDEAHIEVSLKFSDYTDVFSPNLVIRLPEYIGMNNHVIKLEEGKDPPYGLIYSLALVELETLKTYIETHLKTGFI